MTGRVTEFESHDVIFLEEDFPKRGEINRDFQLYETEDPKASGGIRQIDLAPIEQDSMGYRAPLDGSGSEKLSGFDPMEQDHEQSQPRRNNREKIPRRQFEIEGEAFMISHDEEELKTFKEALCGPTSKEWIKAMEEEMNSMKSNHVWDLVDLSLGRKTIGNKWVLNIKREVNETIDRYKARLLAKGYTQQERIDYKETFSLVVRFASIHLILDIVAHMDLELCQMDIKTTFLNEELDEEIYMNQSSLKNKSTKFANSKDLFMVLSKHQDNGISNFIKPC